MFSSRYFILNNSSKIDLLFYFTQQSIINFRTKLNSSIVKTCVHISLCVNMIKMCWDHKLLLKNAWYNNNFLSKKKMNLLWKNVIFFYNLYWWVCILRFVIDQVCKFLRFVLIVTWNNIHDSLKLPVKKSITTMYNCLNIFKYKL